MTAPDDYTTFTFATSHCVLCTGHDHACKLLHHGHVITVSADHGQIHIHDLFTGSHIWVHGQREGAIWDMLAYDESDGGNREMRVLAAYADRTFRIWDATTGTCLYTVGSQTSIVGLLCLSTPFLVSASVDGMLRVWNPNTGQLLHCLLRGPHPTDPLKYEDFKVLSGSTSGFTMWDMQRGKLAKILTRTVDQAFMVDSDEPWIVGASIKSDFSVLDICGFGEEGCEDWSEDN